MQPLAFALNASRARLFSSLFDGTQTNSTITLETDGKTQIKITGVLQKFIYTGVIGS